MKNVKDFKVEKVEVIKSVFISKEEYANLMKKVFGDNIVVNFSKYGIFIYPEYGVLSGHDIYEDKLYKALEYYFDVKEVKSVKYDSANETVKISVVDKENDKMMVPLENGYFTAEKNTDVDHPGIALAFETNDGLVFDLAYAEVKEGEGLKDIDVYTYKDPYSENWTNQFTIRSSDIEQIQKIENKENVKDLTLLDIVRLMYDKKGLLEVVNLDGEGIVCQENGLHSGFFYFNWNDLDFSGSGKEYVQEYGPEKVCEDITLALESMVFYSTAKSDVLGYFLDMKCALTPEEVEKYGNVIDSYIDNILFLLKAKETIEENLEEYMEEEKE